MASHAGRQGISAQTSEPNVKMKYNVFADLRFLQMHPNGLQNNPAWIAQRIFIILRHVSAPPAEFPSPVWHARRTAATKMAC